MGHYKIPSTAPCTIQQVLIGYLLHIQRGLPGSAVSKTLPANAGNIRDAGLTPGSGNLLEEGMTTHSSILAWRIPWTEEPSGPQSIGYKESNMTE